MGVMDLYPISANKTVMENNPFFQDKQIIPDLIDICSTVGIHFETADVLSFEQANLRLTIPGAKHLCQTE